MRSSYPRSPIDHLSNGSKNQIFGQLRSLFLFFFFFCVTSSQLGVLQIGSADVHPTSDGSTDGPNGHRVDSNHRDCGFGRVFVQTHDLVTCTVLPNPSPPNFLPNPSVLPQSDPSRFSPQSSVLGRANMGQLPKLHFPKFDGDNPKLWQAKCENYFDMYTAAPSVWVRVATMHFEGPTAKWLQSVHHRICSATWSELCS
jgi:hypothetical protein